MIYRLATRTLLAWFAINSGTALAADASATTPAAEALEHFENHIRPVLVESCYECHSQTTGTSEGELVLDNRESLLRGGRSGPAIVPGDAGASRLIKAIEYHDAGLQMPPDGKLPAETIDAFRKWIAMGAPDPRDGAAPEISTIASRSKTHWAFQLPQRAVAAGDSSDWATSDVDRLIAAELRSEGLKASPMANRRTLIHRLYFDLVGLAPSAEDIATFEADKSPDAYTKLVDRLLATPQFGERWARHWLDIARFADTKGYVFTQGRDFPNAYKYRDWVIEAFNTDMPIDRFLEYQLAADRMQQTDEDKKHLAAQGFVTLGRRFINNKHDIAADRIDVVFRGMMGLTVACARCHDHKFDPVSDEDYYALYGILASSREEQDEQNPLRLVDDKPHNVGVFIRGSHHNRGPIVERGFLDFFSSFAEKVKEGSGRLELARAIASPENPLTSRVFVNRVWGHLFGEQIVKTPSDFGLRCDAPRQQKVLDTLAVDFMRDGWSLKKLVRSLVTSSTYRQSSTPSPALLAADPENDLWGRMNRRRLDFESLRDRLLATAGKLNQQVGGPSENIAEGTGGTRRTLYAHIDRQNLPNLFRTFDFASPDAHSPERPHTLVPQQALYLMNSPTVQMVARSLTDGLSDLPAEARVEKLYRQILAREPTPVEVELAREFVARGNSELLPPDEWSFGFGRVVTTSSKPQVEFTSLDHFVENRWQARGSFPDNDLGYVSVTSKGGHPGRVPDVCSIRRWTAPGEGAMVIRGTLERPHKEGDGVEGLVVSSLNGIVGRWTIDSGKKHTRLRLDKVTPGEHIDFVVNCRGNDAYDSYSWEVSLTLETASERQTWQSEPGFHGPADEPLDLWTQFAQVLLVSNEFLYVD